VQALTAAPRDHLTEAQVRDLLTRDDITITGGAELLDTSNRVVDDITDDLAAGVVDWDNRATVHGSVRLSLQRELAWGRDRVRPYLTLSHGAVEARFNLGVYVLTAPDTKRGEDPVTYEVTGYDLLQLLQTGPADTWVAEAGTSYLQAILDILDAADVGITVLIGGALGATYLPATRVWAPLSPVPSWRRMIEDLLTEAGWEPPWCTPDGALTSRPIQTLVDRPVEWTLDTTDPATNIVGEDRTLSIEAGDIANAWRFVRKGMATPPVEGDGIYTVQNAGDGPTSQVEAGRTIWKFVLVDAADQTALIAQGDKTVAADMAAVRTITLQLDPLPIMGQDDVFMYTDGGTSEKVQAATWQINLDGSPGTVQLGGAPREPLDEVSTQSTATVTSAAPLRALVDGATRDSFVNALDGATYEVGDRVTVTIRNPLPPLVQGIESTE